MINSVIYCVDNDIDFVLNSEKFLYKSDKGWEDYFLRFWREEEKEVSLEKRKVFHVWGKKDYLFKRIRRYNYSQVEVAKLGLDKDNIFGNKKLITKAIYRYKPEIASIIDNDIKNLKLPNKYAAFHIRRGDKVGEMPAWTNKRGYPEANALEASIYLDKLFDIDKEVRDIFISSDSFEAVKEIKEYIRLNNLDVNIYTTCTPLDKGHCTMELKKNFGNKFDNVIRLLVDVEVSKNSEYFIGCYSSNLSRFVALVHQNPSHCISLDKQKWVPT